VVQVADKGIGMTEEVRHQCLEPFFSTKGMRGTGLGLGMVHGIIRRHEGELTIESAPGEGTTVSLRIPLRRQDAVEVNAHLTAASPGPLRVLVVDDDPLLRRVIKQYLSMDDHQVETASDGYEGLAKYQTGSYDIVLTDRAMAGMGGDELAARIRAITPHRPIAMLTGFGDLMIADGERPEGVDLVISKPVTLDGLRQAVAQLIATAPSPIPVMN
jgi:CheY-like chemotaxis protein